MPSTFYSSTMTPKSEPPEVAVFLRAFQEAWKLVIKDYDARLINGEHTMQASLYRHLLQKLPRKSGYAVFTEAKLSFQNSNLLESEKGRKKIGKKIDLLVTFQRLDQKTPEVIAAVELKFKPRIFPSKVGVQKDLSSLALIRNRRARGDRIDLTMDRFEAKECRLEFNISPQRKLIFATFCRADTAAAKRSFDAHSFWKSYAPNANAASHWAGMGSCPQALGIVFAMTSKTSKTDSKFFGPIFEN